MEIVNFNAVAFVESQRLTSTCRHMRAVGDLPALGDCARVSAWVLPNTLLNSLGDAQATAGKAQQQPQHCLGSFRSALTAGRGAHSWRPGVGEGPCQSGLAGAAGAASGYGGRRGRAHRADHDQPPSAALAARWLWK